MSGSAVITENPNPVALNLTGSTICASPGGNGTITSTTSVSGVSYQLYNSLNSPIQGAQPGNGSGLTWTGLSASNGYYVIATNSATCTATSTPVNVSTTANPAALVLTGSTICVSPGGNGTITSSTSVNGVSYQLYDVSNAAVQTAKAGTGSGLTWSSLPAGSGYYVIATNASTCTATSAPVNVLTTSNPVALELTGSTICASPGGNGTITSSTSVNGVSYQLYNSSNAPVQGAQAGNGSGLTWTGLSAGNGYYVIGTNLTTSCVSLASNTANVLTTLNPVALLLTGSTICASPGGNGTITSTTSVNGVSYQLYDVSNTAVQTAKAGTGSGLTWSSLPAGTGYYVIATNASTCTATSTPVDVSTTANPAAFVLTGNTICVSPGGNGTITSATSVSGVIYQLYNYLNTPVQGTQVGNGSGLTWSSLPASNGYYVIATNAATCTATSTPVNVLTTANPAALILTGSTICVSPGGNGTITSSTSVNGVSYQLYNSSNAPVQGAQAGNGSGLTWTGLSAGNGYYVIGTNLTTSCVSLASNIANVLTTINPVALLLTGSTICVSPGGNGTITSTTSVSGVSYQLYNSSNAPVQGAQAGNGSGLTWTGLSAGNGYYVIATDASTCTATSSPVNIFTTANPVALVLTGSTICVSPGGNGTITSTTSVTGVTYQLYNSLNTPVQGAQVGNGSVLSWTGLLAGDGYYVISTNAATCTATSTPVNISTISNPAAPSGPSPQTFCSGTSPTLANLTVAGILIQWYSAPNGGSILSPTTALANSTHYYASQTINGCESTSRLDVRAVVNTTPEAPSGSATQTFCSGTLPTVANLVASGTLIQWYSSSDDGSLLSPTTTLITGTHYFASQTVSGCESTSRLDVTAVVNTTPLAPAGSATQTFCSGSSPTISNLTATGTSIKWYSLSSGGSALSPALALTNGTHYYASQTSVDGCESNTRLDVTATVNTTPAAPAGSGTQTFCSGSLPTVANLTATGTSIQWYSASSGGSALSSALALANGIHYYASQTVNGCESISRLDVTATINTTPAAPAGSGTQTFCSGSLPTVANLTATGTSIQWYSASLGGSLLSPSTTIVNGTHYFASQTVSGCESILRLDVTAVVNTTPVAPTGSATQTFCSGSLPTVADLTATGTSIQWYLSSGGGSALSPTLALSNGTHYYASQTVSGCESILRFDVTAIVNTTPLAPTGSATQTFCSGASPIVANLTATGTLIQWYSASSGGSALSPTLALTNGTHYYASQTVNGCESISRLNVTAVVNTTPGAPTGSATQSFCSGASPTVANLAAAGTLIQWYSASGGGSLLSPTTTLVNGTHYYASQTVSGCESILRLDVTAVVNITPIVTNQATSILTGGTFTVTPSGADIPAGTTYTWIAPTYLGGVTGGSAQPTPQTNISGTLTIPSGAGTATYTVTPANGSCVGATFTVTVTVTSSCVPVTITTQPSDNNMCVISGYASITAGALGTTPFTYQWQYNNSGTWANVTNGTPAGATYTGSAASTLGISGVTLAGNYQYRCNISNCSGGVSITSNTAILTTNALPAAPTGSATQTFCSGTMPTVANLVASGTLIQWYSASGGGSLLSPATVLVNGTHYYASQTLGGCESISRLDVKAVVNTAPPAPAGSSAQAFCSAASPVVANLAATGTSIKWYNAPSGGTQYLGTDPLINGTHYYASQTSVDGCESTTRLDVTATVNTTPAAPTGSGTQTFCSGSLPTVANLTAAGTSIQWYSSSGGGSALSPASALTNGTHYYASQTINGCESILRLDVTVVVTTTPSSPAGSATQTFCSGSLPTVTNLTATGTLIQWYSASIGGSLLSPTTTLVNGTHYYASQTVSGCESISRLDVTATVNTTPSAPTGSTTQTFCSGALPTVANLSATGTSIQWYSSSGGGSALSPTLALSDGTHYYASQTVSGCESISRLDVTAVVNTTPSAPTGSATQTFCSGASPIVANLTATGTLIQWYSAPGGGSLLSPTASLVNGMHYYASQTVNGCESTSRLNVTAMVNTTPGAPTGSATQSFCSGASPTVANLAASGTLIQWYSASGGGSLLSPTTTLVNGTHYYASQTVNGCESILRLDVTAVVNITPIVTNQATSILTGGTFLVTPSGADIPVGTTYTWIAPTYVGGVTGGSAQATPQTGISGTLTIPSGAGTATYTVTPANGSCVGATFTVTVTVTSSCVPVTITSQPSDNNMCVISGYASLTAGALGTTPFTYQWQYNNSGTWANVTNGTPAGATYAGSAASTLGISGVTLAGNYQYRCNISNCSGGISTISNSATLTVNALPGTPTIGSVIQPTCTSAAGTVTVSGPTGSGMNYSIDGSTYTNSTGVFTLVPAGIYTVTARNSAGCISSGTGVTVNAQPATPAAPTVTLIQPSCSVATGTITVTAPVGSGMTYSINGSTYSNSTGVFNSVTSGSYTVTAKNASGCISAGTPATINAQPLTPTVVITNPAPVCSPSKVDLTASSITSGSTSGLTFTYWTNAGATIAYSTPTTAGAGTYYIKGTTSAGCFNVKPVIVTVNQVPTANAGSGGNECDLTFQFNATPSVGTGTWSMASGPGTATFNPGGTTSNSPNATVTVSAYGTYTFTWTEVNANCSNSHNVTVNFYQQPVANAGTNANNCGLEYHLNGSLNIGTGAWTKVSGPGSVSFTPATSPGATVTVTAYGAYIFRWTVTNGTCSNSSNVNVTFFQLPAADAGTGGVECDLDFALNAIDGTAVGSWSKFTGPGNATFSNASLPNAKVTVDQFGTYQFAWTTTVNGICSSTDMITVSFHDLPVVSAGRDTIICKGGSAQLKATGSGTFSWSPSESLNKPALANPVAVPEVTTKYTVTLTDQYGCKNSDEVEVEVRDKPVPNAGPDKTLEYLLETNMQAELLNNYEEGVWSLLSGSGTIEDTNKVNTTISGLSIGLNNFMWTVTNGACQAVADTVTIKVDDLIIPTLITPNGDPYNEYFVLRGIETLGKTELTIFDRRGAQVYKNNNYDNTWNGLDYSGNALPDDTYFYVIKSQNGKSLSGYIVIRR